MNNVRIAIQTKGKLSDVSLAFLAASGLIFKPNGRNCIVTCDNYALDILFLRDDDIPKYVERGVADFGIVGENVLLEQNVRAKTLQKLPFGFCTLTIAVPQNSGIERIADLEQKKIATSYPNLLKGFLEEEKINANILTLKGSVEIAPSVNLADAVCDLTQTGKTLEENNLKPLVAILESQAVLIQSPFLTQRAAKNFEGLFKQPQ